MKSLNNFMFMMMIILSSMMLISSLSWLNIWIWLEINLISFLMFITNNKKKMSIESSLIYFLIQTISSIILLFSILMIMFKNNFMLMMLLSLLMKLGSFPFHYWIIVMIESMNWMKIFVLLTWQKINPLFMMMMNNFIKILKMFIIMSMLIGSFGGLNFNSLKKILSFSSINQLGWMMLSIMNSKMIKMFMIFYIYMMYMIIKPIQYFNLNFLNQFMNLKLKNKFIKLFIFTNLLSLGGLPPFLGFLPKLIIIMKLNKSIFSYLMILFSLINLFFYLRIILSLMLLNYLKMNIFFKNYNKNLFLYFMKFSLINNFLLIFFFF